MTRMQISKATRGSLDLCNCQQSKHSMLFVHVLKMTTSTRSQMVMHTPETPPQSHRCGVLYTRNTRFAVMWPFLFQKYHHVHHHIYTIVAFLYQKYHHVHHHIHTKVVFCTHQQIHSRIVVYVNSKQSVTFTQWQIVTSTHNSKMSHSFTQWQSATFIHTMAKCRIHSHDSKMSH